MITHYGKPSGKHAAFVILAVSLALEKGEVSIRDLTGVGVFRPLIRPMSDEGFLRRVGYGVYAPGCKAEEFLRQICQLAAA
jgi:hypothetical protein